MIAHYNRKSLAYGIPGLVLQIGGSFVEQFCTTPAAAGIDKIVTLIGTVLLLVGLAFYAKAKQRHPAWCLMACLSIIGWIVLAGLEDKAPDGEPFSSP
jgi:hypothetical protein